VKSFLLCLLLAATAVSCHHPDDYLLTPTLADQVLSVTLSSATLPADGIARTTITAQLDPRTDFDKRSVTFTTTAGTLIADGKEGSSITVSADTNAKAVVELRSSTTAGTAHIDVTVATVSRSTTVEFQQLSREQVYDVAVSSASVPADGFTPVVITVQLKRLGTTDQRAVRFETSAGLFNASGQSASRAVTITAGPTGIVVVELRSDAAATGLVRITALDMVYEFTVSFTALAQSDVFDVAVSSTSIPADGFSTAVITATLKRAVSAQQRQRRRDRQGGRRTAK
jgi:adhesin/invasin